MKYYVYIICHKVTNEYYIGYRGTNLSDPLQDLGIHYFTSGILKNKFKQNPQDFDKAIFFEHENKAVAYLFEQDLISKHLGNKLCKNRLCDREALNKADQLARRTIVMHSKKRKAKSKKKTRKEAVVRTKFTGVIRKVKS